MKNTLIDIIDSSGDYDLISRIIDKEDARNAAYLYSQEVTKGTVHSGGHLRDAFIAGFNYANKIKKL